MRVLLDEMLPRELGFRLEGHDAVHVTEMHWMGLKNGALLSECEENGFKALLTKDSNMPFQQNIAARKLALLVLRPASQSVEDILALATKILSALNSIKDGEIVTIS
jgi:hypothetical protein